MIYLGSSETLLAEFKLCMEKEFKMTDLGMLQYFLGLEVKQVEDGIFVSQRKYARDLLSRFAMYNCKDATTSMNTNEKSQLADGTEVAKPTLYKSLIGGLNYLTRTCPDITFSVSVMSRFMHNLTKQHFGAAKRVLRYIAGTVDFGIWYFTNSDLKLFGYSDSGWAACTDDRRSTSGHVFGLSSRVISWSSKKQDEVALSSSKA